MPEGLNAAQVAAVQTVLQDIVAQMKLRQWCIEKALEFSANDPVPLASQIYNFVVPAVATMVSMSEAN